MAFTLDSTTLGTLGGGFYKTVPFDCAGTGREFKITLIQTATQDMEPHWMELHVSVGGVSKEDL